MLLKEVDMNRKDYSEFEKDLVINPDYTRVQKLEIKGRFKSLNEVIEINRTHRMAAANQKRKEDDRVAFMANKHLRKVNGIADFHIVFLERSKRRDKDNIIAGGLKSIFDGLIKANILPDDGWKEVNYIYSYFAVAPFVNDNKKKKKGQRRKRDEKILIYVCELKPEVVREEAKYAGQYFI